MEAVDQFHCSALNLYPQKHLLAAVYYNNSSIIKKIALKIFKKRLRIWDIKFRNCIYLKLSENNILESLIKYDKIYKNISAGELKEIESIDLRIPKQAIIKFKN